LLSNLPILG